MSGFFTFLFKNATSLASIAAPKTVGRIAFRLFTTPSRATPQNSYELASFNRARARLEKFKFRHIHFDGERVGLYDTGELNDTTGEKSVILVHGWTASSASMVGIARSLNRCGYRTILVDLPAHGESSGRRLFYPNAVKLLSQLCQSIRPYALVGHSFGGCVLAGSVNAEENEFSGVKKVVMIASPSKMSDVVDSFHERIGLCRKAKQAFRNRLESSFGALDREFEIATLLSGFEGESLYIHDSKDSLVSPESVRELQIQNPEIQVFCTSGLGHRKVLGSPIVFRRVNQFMDSNS